MKTKAVIATFVLSFFLLAVPVLAQAGKPFGTPPVRRGLTEAKLRSCEAREDAVKTRMNSLLRMATNMIEKFDAVAQRVKDFYTNTVLPSGKSVPNYDELVADIAAKKAIVEADLTSAQNNVNAFTCSGDDPKGLLTQFRTDMQKVKTDLKNFRTSIKNLIVAVRGLAPTPKPEESEGPEDTEEPEGTDEPEETEEPEETATPTVAPTATP